MAMNAQPEMSFEELQEYVAEQVGLEADPHAIVLDALKEAITAMAQKGRPLPAPRFLMRFCSLGVDRIIKICEEMAEDGRVVKVSENPPRYVPAEYMKPTTTPDHGSAAASQS